MFLKLNHNKEIGCQVNLDSFFFENTECVELIRKVAKKYVKSSSIYWGMWDRQNL
ncbi:hypothetical protein B4092_4895 [Bacillus licheniformis]|nr:hypothetical protein B4092_4895 [Bacillus licheniformis]